MDMMCRAGHFMQGKQLQTVQEALHTYLDVLLFHANTENAKQK